MSDLPQSGAELPKSCRNAPTAPVLVVGGLGRCGLTAMMNALHAGGVPCAGAAPAFEPQEAMPPMAADWLSAQAGRAVKTLLPHEHPALRMVPHVAIVMHRDPVEQGMSQCKMLTMLSGLNLTRSARRWMIATIPRDQRLAEDALTCLASVDFAELVRAPAATMQYVAALLRPWWRLDADKAAAVIHQRSAACAPGLDAEIAMLSDA